MSTITFSSNRRNIWLNQHHHPLRKQNSLIEENSNNIPLKTTATVKSKINQNKDISSNNNYSNYNSNHNNLNSNLINFRSLSDRGNRKFSILKKQISFDQVYNTRINRQHQQQQNNHYPNNNSINSTSEAITLSNGCSDTNGKKELYLNKNPNPNWKSNNASLSVVSNAKFGTSIISKRKTIQQTDKIDLTRKGKNTNERIKTPKESDDRINLNIFLGHSLTVDNDDIDSDIGSNPESVKNLVKGNVKLSEKKLETASQNCLTNTNSSQHIEGVQLQINRNIEKNTVSSSSSVTSITLSLRTATATNISNSSSLSSSVPNAIISAVPSLTIQRRPPLIRTMSAPVRSSLNDNSKNILLNKRKPLRRRKFLTRSTSIDKSSTSVPTSNNNENHNIINGNNRNLSENDENVHEKSTKSNNNSNITNNSNRKTINKVKNSIGCDVVTLVSLISSEGSDSEKEEITQQITSIGIDTQAKRAPFLRKTGKSVSFQDDDIPILKNSNKEPSYHFLRRGSLAPLAARLRSNRPPTAPPVPIFMTETENSNLRMLSSKVIKNDQNHVPNNKTTNMVNISNNNNSESSSSSSDDKESKLISEDTTENQFPEYIKSSKERECWKLFMKMTMKGVTVTYDTILRGMLTPTELRILQKQQKEFEIANQIQENDDEQQKQQKDGTSKLKEINKENTISLTTMTNNSTKVNSINTNYDEMKKNG